jgi:glycosyltransferase involved in cell wall biosynthesis
MRRRGRGSARPVRILLASANRTLHGGAETYQHALIAPLAASGHQTALLYERTATIGRPTVDAGTGIPVWGTGEGGREAALAEAARWRPDVVYVQGLASPVLEARLLERWPGVLFAHGYYGTCETGTKRHAFPRVAACTRRFGPACLALHHARRCGGLGVATMVRGYRRQAARLALLPQYRAVCVASAHMRREYVRHAIAADRLHVLPLPPAGIIHDPSPPVGRVPVDNVVLAGRLTGLKGGALLVDALPQASRKLGRPISLTVIGDGPERLRLDSRARGNGVAARFLGWVGIEERNRILRTAGLLAMPSVWPEPWGLIGLEAACAGVPTVAFAIGAIPEWLEPGQSGELAPAEPPTAEGLAAAIVRALGDPAHYAGLCVGAWNRVQHFTVERHIQGLLPVLAGGAA